MIQQFKAESNKKAVSKTDSFFYELTQFIILIAAIDISNQSKVPISIRE